MNCEFRSFNPITGVNILKVESVSQEQALQRAGRVGRQLNGVCYRAYSSEVSIPNFR